MIRIFKHYIPKSLVVLGLVEACIFIISTYIGTALRFGSEVSSDIQPLFPKAFLFFVMMASSMTAMGLYQRHLQNGLRGMFLRVGLSFLVGFVLMSLIFYLFPALFLGRGVFASAFAVAVIGILIARITYIRLVDQNTIKRRILVLGAGQRAALIEKLLNRAADRRGFEIVGYVPFGDEELMIDTAKIVHHELPIIDIAREHDVDELVVAVTDRRKGLPVDEILDCKMNGIHIVDQLTFFERQNGRVILEILQPSWLIFSDGFGQSWFRTISKRLFDVTASLLLLIVAFPFMIVTIIAIFLDDRSDIFYRQVRVGQNWKLFQVLKFRSMRPDAEKISAPQFAEEDDPRVTRVGRIIRKLRIDELPQLINVLKGDMSFVGPRPERPEFVEQFSESIPYYAERHRVKPGITGWAQISYPYGAGLEDTIEKLQYDLYYVKNYSLFFDFMILFLTAEVILWGKGAR